MLGPQAAAAEAHLVDLLDDMNPDVHEEAAEALARVCGVTAVPHLIGHLQEEDRFIREPAVNGLQVIGPAAAEAVPELIGLLNAQSVDTRSAVIRVLGGIGPSARRAVPRLLPLLAVPFLRKDVVTAIESIGPSFSGTAQYLAKLLSLLKSSAAEDRSKFVMTLRRWAVQQRFTVFPDAAVVPFPVGPLVEPAAR